MRSHLNPVAVAANLYRYAYLVRQLLKADRILAPSGFLREVYGRNGVNAARIAVCDYGIASPPPELAERLRARQRHEPLRFGFLGALIPDKGVHVLVEAFNRLPAGRFSPPPTLLDTEQTGVGQFTMCRILANSLADMA